MGDVLLKVENVSKRFCGSLIRSFWYGLQDLGPRSAASASRLVWPPSDLQLCRSLYSCTDSGRRPSRNEPRGRQPLQPRDHRPALDELPWYVLNMHRPLSEPLGGWPC